MEEKSTIDIAYVFGPFRLVPRRRTLFRDNVSLKLGGRALDILQMLVSRAGEEVSKAELIECAWPGTFVDANNLKVHIRSIRRSLDETLSQPSYITTVVGRGYQFVAPVLIENVEDCDFIVPQGIVTDTLPELPALLGRTDDIEMSALALKQNNFVTLVGPGGVGKTSLAVAIAHAVNSDYPDGVHFIDLTATDNSTLVPHLIATALGIRADPNKLMDSIVEFFEAKRSLIILDNCEHILSAASLMARQFIQGKTNSCLLLTSREPLGINSERLHRVKPLPYPDRVVESAKDALRYPSVQLFVMRAMEITEYSFVDHDAQNVADLCRVLDGLPLAIEIAAANLDRFSPEDLLASVARRLSLSSHDNEAHLRHKTLWATLDWSYQLLSTEESTIFRLLSVFAGSFEWSDVAAVSQLVRYDPYQITVGLSNLVAKSFISVEVNGEQLRYRLLESARSYAASILLKDPVAHDAMRCHAEITLALFKKSEVEWGRLETAAWRARYEVRVGDLRKALDWCFSADGDSSLGVALTISAIRFWNEQSSIFEQLAQVGRALNQGSEKGDLREKAALATALAWTMTLAGKLLVETDDAWDDALSISKSVEDLSPFLAALYGKAVYLIYTGRSERSRELMREFNHIAAELGDRALVHDGERLASLAELHLGRLEDARIKLKRLERELAEGMGASRIARYQEEGYVGVYTALAFSNFLAGECQQAIAMSEAMVVKTKDIGMAQSHIIGFVALPIAFWSSDIEAFERLIRNLGDNLESQNIALWEPVYRYFQALAAYKRGYGDAVDAMQSAVDELINRRFLVRTPFYLGIIADAHLEMGRIDRSEAALERAFELDRKVNEEWCFSELMRIKARILAARGQPEQASSVLDAALNSAHELRAIFFEARIKRDIESMALPLGSSDGNLPDRQKGSAEPLMLPPSDGEIQEGNAGSKSAPGTCIL